MDFEMSHLYRESNCVADKLANIGCKDGKYLLFEN